MDKYILVDKIPVVEPDLMKWALSMNTPIHVGDTNIHGIRISTVFLGLDHSFPRGGDPVLFETMVFSPYWEENQMHRYHTWEEAERGHQIFVEATKRVVRRHIIRIYLMSVCNSVRYFVRGLMGKVKKKWEFLIKQSKP